MGIDVESHLGAVERSVSSLERGGQHARAVTLSRSYATTVEDLWDAVTNGERIPRWFLPVSGELGPGGRYQLEGNAGGVITVCERQSHFALTWEFGEDVSWVECVFRAMETAGCGLHSRTQHSFRNTGVSTGLAQPASAGSWVSWDSRSISCSRTSQCRTKPLLLLRRTVKRSSQGAARSGRKRRWRPERNPTPRMPQQGVRRRSTLGNRLSLPDALAASNLGDSKGLDRCGSRSS